MVQQAIEWFMVQMRSFVKPNSKKRQTDPQGFFMEQMLLQRSEDLLLCHAQITHCGWKRERECKKSNKKVWFSCFLSLRKNHVIFHLKRHVLNLDDPPLVSDEISLISRISHLREGHSLWCAGQGVANGLFYPAKCIQLCELALNKAMIFGKERTEHYVLCCFGGVCGRVVNTLNSGSGGAGFKPCLSCCFFRQGTLLYFVSLHPDE